MEGVQVSDEYTVAMRLCDDAGMVSHESVDEDRKTAALADPKLTYLDRLNFLRNLTRIAQGSKPETIDEPFACTGHAHLAGEHIRCTSPAHAKTISSVKLIDVSMVSDPLPGYEFEYDGEGSNQYRKAELPI